MKYFYIVFSILCWSTIMYVSGFIAGYYITTEKYYKEFVKPFDEDTP